MYTYMYVYVCLYVCVYVCMYASMYVLRVCICVYVRTCALRLCVVVSSVTRHHTMPAYMYHIPETDTWRSRGWNICIRIINLLFYCLGYVVGPGTS